MCVVNQRSLSAYRFFEHTINAHILSTLFLDIDVFNGISILVFYFHTFFLGS